MIPSDKPSTHLAPYVVSTILLAIFLALEDEASRSRHPEPRCPQLSAALTTKVKVIRQNQEQFLLLAKSAKGAALVTLIHQVLQAHQVLEAMVSMCLGNCWIYLILDSW